MSKSIPFINDRGWEVVASNYLTTKLGMSREDADGMIERHGWEKVMRACEELENKQPDPTKVCGVLGLAKAAE